MNGKVPDWWYNTCIIIHISHDKSLFKIYIEFIDGQEIKIGNVGCSKVVEKGDVKLIFNSRKRVTLTNVLHVREMNKSIVNYVLLVNRVLNVYMSRKN